MINDTFYIVRSRHSLSSSYPSYRQLLKIFLCHKNTRFIRISIPRFGNNFKTKNTHWALQTLSRRSVSSNCVVAPTDGGDLIDFFFTFFTCLGLLENSVIFVFYGFVVLPFYYGRRRRQVSYSNARACDAERRRKTIIIFYVPELPWGTGYGMRW